VRLGGLLTAAAVTAALLYSPHADAALPAVPSTIAAGGYMAESFLGEIKLIAFNYAPKNWATCDGQLLSIAQNSALFALIGTQYGGNGVATFALPDLRGRTPMHAANGQPLGVAQGSATIALTPQNTPAHTHTVNATNAAGDTPVPTNTFLAAAPPGTFVYGPPNDNPVALNPIAVSPSGQNAAHDNMQPYLTMMYCICTSGIFPSRT
jgi:microcystin-dependent protein